MIPKDFDTAHAVVVDLVQNFEKDFTHYKRPQYDEASVRKDFIDKFFIALGWDVNHEVQRNPYAQEVKVEKSVTVAERVKKADYSFALAPNFRDVHFFVEAKKPSVDIGTPENCFQIIRYAYSSSRASLSIITDFEQLHVMDCRFRPDIATAQKQIHLKFHYTDFRDPEKFAKLYYLFGRDAVEQGALAEYSKTLPKPKGRVVQRKLHTDGYQEVDESFLAMLERFRVELARMFKRKNHHLGSDDLTEAVQRTLDRLIFIRFLEDKVIEQETIIDKFANARSAWQQFIAKSREFDKSYNGIIFKEHGIIDSAAFQVDDRVFLSICDELASDRSPYHFNYIPIHILGSIYERFLGNVITVTAKRAVVEPKPEVRKAGGVFYTPQYIVKYIVENTVGELVKGKAPADVAKMRFADIACGSGSFLLGVYEYLLQWHTEYYNRKGNVKEAREAGCIVNEDGTFHLSFEQKKEILVNNVYGVDIDRQAHEVTQLSLYLKLLEEETLATKRGLWDTTRKAMLPTLTNNIVCGNALVDWDITGGDLFERLDAEKERKLNPMSFSAKFPEIMRNGGFDAIVGNPPYVRQEQLSHLKTYFKKKYEVYHGIADLYTYFLERYFQILHPDGNFGIIVSNGWMRANFGAPLRRFLAKKDILEIIDFNDLPVFKGVAAYPCIMRVTNRVADQTFRAVNVETLDFGGRELAEYIADNQIVVNQEMLDDRGWTLADENAQKLMSKLRAWGKPLGEYVNGEIYRGVLTGLNEAFVIDAETKDRLIAEDARSAELIKPFLAGRDIKRYATPTAKKFLISIPKGFTNKNIIGKDPWQWFISTFPAIAGYLAPFAKAAEARGDKGDYWWELRACDYYSQFETPKVLFPDISERGNFTYDVAGFYFANTGYMIAKDDRYLLGLLNSSVFYFFYCNVTSLVRGGYLRFFTQYVEQMPIRMMDGDFPPLAALRDLIVRSVEQILEAKVKLNEAVSESDRDFWEGKCDSLEHTIDNAVYKLYDLTPDEIKLIENA